MKGNPMTKFHLVKPATFETFYRTVRGEYGDTVDYAGRAHLIREATSPFSHVDGTRYYVATDGTMTGYAIRPDGELVFVFAYGRGRGDAIVSSAVENGATHLDCFDGHLTELYARHGFQRVTSLPNWTEGEPDVVYMAAPGHFLAALDKAVDKS